VRFLDRQDNNGDERFFREYVVEHGEAVGDAVLGPAQFFGSLGIIPGLGWRG
jgi:hypothetical protein